MNNELSNYQNAFTVIADLWPNFKQPVSTIGIAIWDKALEMYPERTVISAIEKLYKTEHFFSFAKLTEILDTMTRPQLPEPGEVIQTIKKLASNSNRDISDQPDFIRLTVSYMGGLKSLGQEDWDEWLEKRIAQRYEEAKSSLSKQELLQLNQAAERLGIE